jgi:hypothetical protein
VLCAHSALLSFTDSFAAPISVANALLTGVAAYRRGESLAHLERVEELWTENDVYQAKQRRPGGPGIPPGL